MAFIEDFEKPAPSFDLEFATDFEAPAKKQLGATRSFEPTTAEKIKEQVFRKAAAFETGALGTVRGLGSFADFLGFEKTGDIEVDVLFIGSSGSVVLYSVVFGSIIEEIKESLNSLSKKQKTSSRDLISLFINSSEVYPGFNLFSKKDSLNKETKVEMADLYSIYAYSLMGLGQYESSLKYIEKAIEFDPLNATLLDHLGDVYFRMGNSDKAIELWKESLLLDSSNTEIQTKIENGLD